VWEVRNKRGLEKEKDEVKMLFEEKKRL